MKIRTTLVDLGPIVWSYPFQGVHRSPSSSIKCNLKVGIRLIDDDWKGGRHGRETI